MNLRPLLAALLLLVPAMAGAIEVGATIPAFTAQTPQAKPVAFPAVSGKNGAVLVFFRSAKWCPYCQRQLIDLKAAQAPLAKRGYSLAAISYDTPDQLAKFAADRGVGYRLLSDTGSKTIDAFGLRDPQYDAGSYAYGVPKPTILVVSPKGVVRAKLAEEGYKTRPGNAAILAAVDALPRR